MNPFGVGFFFDTDIVEKSHIEDISDIFSDLRGAVF